MDPYHKEDSRISAFVRNFFKLGSMFTKIEIQELVCFNELNRAVSEGLPPAAVVRAIQARNQEVQEDRLDILTFADETCKQFGARIVILMGQAIYGSGEYKNCCQDRQHVKAW